MRQIRCFVAVLAMLPLCGTFNAQVLYGSLTGNVTDPSGLALPNATVEARNTGTGAVKQTSTNDSGSYLLSDLQPGAYTLTITSQSFAKLVQEGVTISANQSLRVDAKLEVARVSQSVIVSGTAEALQTDRADVSTNINTRQLANLPINGNTGRNFQSLVTLVPGSSMMAAPINSAGGDPQRSLSYNVNGVSRLQNGTRVDGSSIAYPWLPTNLAYVPPVESIETVNVVTNSFNAEQGLAGGAALSLTIKSGTNDLHGTAWIFNTDSHFKARNFFQTTPQNPKNILNQFGLNVGGPVWIPKLYNGKNKLFFFVNWERTLQRLTSPQTFQSLAPTDLRNGDFSAAAINTTIYDPASNADPSKRTGLAGNRIPVNRIDPASLALINLLAQPNVGGLTGAGAYVNNYVATGVAKTDRDAIDIKINHHVTDAVSYFGRYSVAPSTIIDPPSLGAAGGNALNGGQLGTAFGRIQVGGAGVTYVIRPNLLLDVNAGYTRQRLGAEAPDINQNLGLTLLHIPGTNGTNPLQGGLPFFNVSNWANMGNSNTGNPFLFRDNQYVASTNLGWTKGTHSLRFGWEGQDQQLNHFQAQGGTFQTVRGTFQFNGSSTALQNGKSANNFNSWADFLLGDASGAGKVMQRANPNSLRLHAYALYAQDQWQVSSKLTLDYGLRWEWYPFPRTDHGGVARFDPADGNVYIGGVGNVPADTGASSGAGEFLPRLGIAYRVSEKTVIRTGAGFSADPKPFIDFRNAYPNINAWQMPAVQFNGSNNTFKPVTTLRQGLDEATYGQFPSLGNGIIKLPANSGTTAFPKNAMRKYIESWNFMVQHEFAKSVTAQAGYVGTRAVGQEQFVNINAGPPATPGQPTGNAARPLASSLGLLSDINEIMPYKTTTYDGLQSQVTRRWGDSVLGAVYTWSKTIDWADNDANPRIQWPGAWNLNRGPAGYDRTHNFQGYFVLPGPFGKGRRWAQQGILSHLLGGWELNGVLSAESGLPIYVIQGTGNNLNAAGSSQVPDLVKSSVAILGGIGTGHPYFDTTAFAAVNIPSTLPQRFGNSGRDNIRGPGLFNIDSGLFRTFTIKERLNLQFRAEGLNVLNHANFSNPASDVSNPSGFGYVTSTLTGERQFRFAVRVSF